MSRLFGGSKDAHKFAYELNIRSVDGLSLPNGVVYVAWKRGSKAGNHGETKAATVKDRRVEFNEPLHFSSTLYKSKKGYEEKNIVFSLMEASAADKEKEKEKDKDKKKEKKGSALAKVVVDLAEYAAAKDETRKTFKLAAKKLKGTPTLTISIRAKETELGPDEDYTDAGATEESGGASDEEEDMEDFKDDDDSIDSAPSPSKRLSVDSSSSSSSSSTLKSPSGSRSSVTIPSTASSTSSSSSPAGSRSSTTVAPVVASSSSSTITSSSGGDDSKLREELEAYKKKEADLKKRVKELAGDNVDQEETITELRKQMDEMGKKGGSGAAAQAASSKEIGDLKKRIKELANENVDMEEKITQLEKDLKDAKAGGGNASDSAELVTLRGQVQSLTHDVKFKDAQVEAIKEENDKLKKEASTLSKSKDKDKGDDAQVASLRADLEKAKAEVEKLKKEAKEKPAAAAVVAAAATSPADEAKVSDLRKRVKELANENVEQEETIIELRKELDTLRADHDKAVAAASAATAAAAASSSASDKKSSGELEFKKKIVELTQTIKEKDDQTDKARTEADKLKKEVEKLRADVTDAKAAAAAAATASAVTSSGPTPKELDLKKKIKELANENVDMEERIEALEKELQEARSSGAASGGGSGSGSGGEEEERLRGEVETLENKVSKLKKEMKQRESDSAHKEEELQARIVALEAKGGNSSDSDDDEREAAKERARKLEKEVKDLKEKVRTLEAQAKVSVASSKRQSHDSDSDREDSGAGNNAELSSLRLISKAIYTQPMSYADESGMGRIAHSLFAALSEGGFENEALLDDVLEALHISIVRQPLDLPALCYWLSNACAFLHQVKEEGVVTLSNDRDPLLDGVPKLSDSEQASDAFDVRLEGVVFEAYTRFLRSIYEKMDPLLVQNILEIGGAPKKKELPPSPNIFNVLDEVLKLAGEHLLYDAVLQQLFRQIFYHINAVLLNEVLKSSSLSTPTSGFRIKLALSKLDDWLSRAGDKDRQLWAPVGDQLEPIRQAANLMVIDKSIFAEKDTLKVFPSLNVLQVKKMLETFQPDPMAPLPMPPSVIAEVHSSWGLSSKGLSLYVDTDFVLAHE